MEEGEGILGGPGSMLGWGNRGEVNKVITYRGVDTLGQLTGASG